MKSSHALTVLAFAGALSLTLVHHVSNNQLSNTNRASRAAFQDGLYLGRLAARRVEAPRACSGRWASASDRALFSEGYAEGYGQNLRARMHRKSELANDGAPYLGRLDAQQDQLH
jgi:hypothetical protein